MHSRAVTQNHTAPDELAVFPERLIDFLEAWDSARRSYEAVLRSGVLRDDTALARDEDYRQLLADGLKIRALGGEEAIIAATVALSRICERGSHEHFAHLWNGLVPSRHN